MANIIRVKPVQQIQTFGSTCGRCGGQGTIASLNPNAEGGLCPVCKGSGAAQVFETYGDRSVGLPAASSRYADGISVTSSSAPTGGKGRRTSRGR